MKIDEIGNLRQILNVKRTNKVNTVGKDKKGDKIEISKEAKELTKSKSNLTPERIAEITKRINEKFYDRDDVLKVVADQLMKSNHFRDLSQDRFFDKNI